MTTSHDQIVGKACTNGSLLFELNSSNEPAPSVMVRQMLELE